MKTTATKPNLRLQLEWITQLLPLFDMLPDVNFFIKDRKGRFAALNRTGRDYCGLSTESDAIGKTDHDFFSPARAAKYRADDQNVMKTGQPMFNAIEPAPDIKGSPHLVIVNKIPLRDASGRVVGIAGISRRIEQVRHAPDTAKKLAATIDHLHQKYAEPLTSQALAKMAGMSVSQFERSFRKTLGTSPRQYLLQVRITNACRMLAETNKSIAALAVECGFYDHAHFTRLFRQHTGHTPVAHRKRSRGRA